jgi:hypothetical protein
VGKAAARAAEKPRLFANHSDAQIADEWGPLSAKLKKAQDRLEALKAEFELRKLTVAQGEAFVVLKNVTSQRRFSGESAKAEMGEDWYREHQKPSERTEYVVSALTPVAG